MLRRSLLPTLAIVISISSFAQQTSRTAYAITGGQKGEFNWAEVHLIDLNTGEVVKSVYEKNSQPQIINARTGKPISFKKELENSRQSNNSPFSTLSAACAYDKKHNRLYYTPMGINQLRYIDLNAEDPKIFYFENEPFGSVTSLKDEANHITRMVIGSDGHGYALSNDAKHLIRFTTGRKPVITDLGNLVDDPNNKDVSVHLRCSSWGGDMVADAFGKLYLISARQAVFVIDVESRIATYKGYIEGLPGNYTTNGAVVDGDGNVIVSSANSVNAYYTVDLNTLKATAIKAKEKVFNTSDLANGNLALQKEADKKASAVSAAQVDRRDLIRNEHVTIYPNPVTEGNFRMYFKDQQLGKYEIQLVDLTGRIISSKAISVVNKVQVEEVQVQDNLARGLYLVKLVGGNKRATFADRILVQ